MRSVFTVVLLMLFTFPGHSEDGYRLWLRYEPIKDPERLDQYRQEVTGWIVEGSSPTAEIIRKELQNGINGLLDDKIPEESTAGRHGIVIAGTPQSSPILSSLPEIQRLKTLNNEGYLIVSTTINGNRATVIAADEEVAVLYGVFHFLRLMQTHFEIRHLSIESSPNIKVRILNHWDHLDGSIDRGYAGGSIWDWQRLPGLVHQRYHDYARANASIGLNGTVLTSPRTDPVILSSLYLKKVAALADVFRLYGIKVYLPARHTDPVELGGLHTADPLNPDVQRWWDAKVDEIYAMIPDFGGFLVGAHPALKENRRTQAEGASVMANAVQRYGGVVIWRATIYSKEVEQDRVKQGFADFKRTDGSFKPNVLLQVRNGPLEFLPIEPFNPIFGAVPKTPLMAEFQLSQMNLGFSTHLVYLGPMIEQTLKTDTHTAGNGSTIARIIDGTQDSRALSGISAVANIGTDRNWTGHTFGQANWYAFGRMAWNYDLEADDVAEEWIRMTFGNDPDLVSTLEDLMMKSWLVAISYMAPLGLNNLATPGHRYGPAPWVDDRPRADQNPTYYHKADREGIGFDRTSSGSDALSLYSEPVQSLYASPEVCPDELLLWFHHASWDFITKSGNTLWDELCFRLYAGVDSVNHLQMTWSSLENQIDPERYSRVRSLLAIQLEEARWWRDALVLYFRTVSRKKIPKDLEKPSNSLNYFQDLTFPYVDGQPKNEPYD